MKILPCFFEKLDRSRMKCSFLTEWPLLIYSLRKVAYSDSGLLPPKNRDFIVLRKYHRPWNSFTDQITVNVLSQMLGPRTIVPDMNAVAQLVGVAGIGSLIYLYVSNNVVRYYVKHIFLTIALTTCASVFIPLMLWRPKSYKNAFLPAITLKYAGRLLGVKCIVRGRENIVQDSGCIVLMNHQSIVDLLVLAELWPILGRATVIAKKEIFYMWPFGLACWLWGTIYIDRLNGPKAKDTINSTANTIREKKAKLCMFPEGTRHGGKDLLPFKKGAFHVAISSQCPIQPIVISQYYFLNSKKHVFDGGVINIEILEPIATNNVNMEDIATLISSAYDKMNNSYHTLTQNTIEEVGRKR